MYFAERKAYNKGEYILKFKNVRDFWIDPADGDIEVLNWGKIIENNEKNDIYIYNVSKIYEPEPDRILIHYIEPKFTEIPEWIFSKKVTSKVMSKFSIDRISLSSGSQITNIPEGLFKHNVNATDFGGIFQECTGLTSIPKIIVEFAKKIKEKGGYVYYTFNECTSASNYTSISNYMK